MLLAEIRSDNVYSPATNNVFHEMTIADWRRRTPMESWNYQIWLRNIEKWKYRMRRIDSRRMSCTTRDESSRRRCDWWAVSCSQTATMHAKGSQSIELQWTSQLLVGVSVSASVCLLQHRSSSSAARRRDSNARAALMARWRRYKDPRSASVQSVVELHCESMGLLFGDVPSRIKIALPVSTSTMKQYHVDLSLSIVRR
jgi:hypothetical protein